MLDHFASAKEARQAVEPFLRRWELGADLEHPEEHLRFVYERPEMVDRAPSSNRKVMAGGISSSTSLGSVRARISRARWPEPPADLDLSPLVEALRAKWLDYQVRPDDFLLQAAAYWALTMIEAAPRAAGTAERTSHFFNISSKVLKKFGELSSTRGRKAGGKELTPTERRWLQAAFKALVKQAALQAHRDRPPCVRLTMANLPDLAS